MNITTKDGNAVVISEEEYLGMIETLCLTSVPGMKEKLIGDLQGLYSRSINVQHRLVYEVFEEEKIIKIISLWTHYGK